MARPAHPESSRRGPLVAAVAACFILSFLPQRALNWVKGPQSLLRYVLYPVSDPVRSLASRLRPPAPKSDDPLVDQLKLQIEQFKTLYQQSRATIEDQQRLINALQSGAAAAEGPIRQLQATIVAGSSSGVGGTVQVRAGTRDRVELSTIASTDGVQLVGRVAAVGTRHCTVMLLTDHKSGPIDGVIFADDGSRLAQIRNLSPHRNQRVLQGQVQYTSPPAPDPKIDDIVRLDDKGWPRAAQRLIIGKVVDVQKGVAGRILVTVKPTVELERLRELTLLLSPAAEGGGGP